jgi:hypothetical protein
MRVSKLATYALGLMAAAMLAACSSGGSSVAPSGVGSSAGLPGGHIGRAMMLNGLLVTAAHPAQNARLHQGGAAPDKHKKKKKLYQWGSNFENSTVLQFDYPKGDSSIGSVSASDSQGECTNGKAKKTWWVSASGADEVDEFSYKGGSPIATLDVSEGEPAGCAIDPTTGNLAETILSNGEVVIFTNASGSGTAYSTPLIEAFFDGYDKNGNLYADGFNGDDEFQLVELPKGSSTFEDISISNSVDFPGAVQWDGTYVTVNDQEAHDIYQYTVSGTTATLEGTVALNGTSDCVQTWIAGSLVFCPDAGNSEGYVFKYPAGGSSIATLTGDWDLPIGFVQVAK